MKQMSSYLYYLYDNGFYPISKSPVSLLFRVEELCHDSFLLHSMTFLVYSESPQYII